MTDPGDGQLKIDEVSVTSETGRTDLIFRNVHEDLVTKKDVFAKNDATVSIGGKKVLKGDILTYVITYKNYTGKAVDVTITDTIPAYTAYVTDSANNGGILHDNVLTWEFADVEPDAVITVSFSVIVTGADVEVANQAVVLEDDNTYKTNVVANPAEDVPTPPPATDDENPKTGDTTNITGMILLAGFGLLGVVTVLAVLLLQRKKNSAEL